MIGYPRLVRSAVLRSLARILLPSVDGRPPRMRTGKSKCYASKRQAGKYTERKPLLCFRGRQDSWACRDCQLYVDSGEPITLRRVDCDLRCSSGILVCGMNFFG